MDVFNELIDLKKKQDLELIEKQLKELTTKIKELEQARKIIIDEKEALKAHIENLKSHIFQYLNNNNFLSLTSFFESVNIKIANGKISLKVRLPKEVKEKIKPPRKGKNKSESPQTEE